ncbi:hypothetical protein K431DRAFT_320853 [Polychaeton citri CBS 116435]|uniref:SWR1-complex protein 4 n=1 Tax=Polychaeton citri CBS 116435 TaxID=1314669 RepID=A0A9P4Q7T7_9PEZI|nr:hypothetical protein K431DRAFT_320853 [Polychaeton citri CBS 116435]
MCRAKYNVQVDSPTFTDEIYETRIQSDDWTKDDTELLCQLYKECAGKWPVVVDRWTDSGSSTPDRTLEQLKKRFYTVSATTMEMKTPQASMTGADFELFKTLQSYDPSRDAQRRQLAEGHMQRRQSEADEESVLLAELQKIMANQVSVDAERDDLRRRLDYPHANTNGYQYSTSQALTGLWQQLLAADRLRKNQRLKPIPGDSQSATRDRASVGGAGGASSAAHSNGGANSSGANTDSNNKADRRASLAQQPGSNVDNFSAADKLRMGIVQSSDKLPSGVTFASDKLTKPRIAKSTIQTDKIAAILSHIGVPEVIPLPTPPVIEAFESLMSKVHILLDMRKLAEREDQEVKTREAEKKVA